MTPMFEDVGVFNRGIGEESDVVDKEMYVFEDRGERRYALRPEGTASVVRAFVQHQPTTPWKAWYVTPAFRYERPQAGRYRQHHQLGVEVLGTDDPTVDVEVIALAERFYRALGLRARRRCSSTRWATTSVARPTSSCCARTSRRTRASSATSTATTWRENPLRVLDCKRPGLHRGDVEGSDADRSHL